MAGFLIDIKLSYINALGVSKQRNLKEAVFFHLGTPYFSRMSVHV